MTPRPAPPTYATMLVRAQRRFAALQQALAAAAAAPALAAPAAAPSGRLAPLQPARRPH